MNKYISEANTMSLIRVYGHNHVIRPFKRGISINDFSEPNYLGTGEAFVGILKKYQTFEDFKSDWVKMKKKFDKI